MRINKKIIVGILLFVIPALLLSLSLVSAEFWACLDYGEVVHYCNNYKPDRTCGSSNGCEYCMSIYREEDDCFIHGAWPKCMKIPRECSFGGGGSIDTEPPIITLNSPEQDEVYDSRSVMLDVFVNEKSDIYYLDNINGRGRWTRVCTDCFSYQRERRFDEGLNDLTFKASDAVGNEAFLDVSFILDSKDPKIKKTEPRRGFFGSTFEVQFKEENPVSLIITYGNYLTGFEDVEVNLEACEEDERRDDQYYCSVDVDVEDYDGEEISYYFTLTDIAGNVDVSKEKTLEVDTTFPVLNNANSFWMQGEGRYIKYIYFTFNITEENFDEVSYIDWSDSRPRWRRLCSRLRDGICEKKKSFRRGFHNVDIQVLDEAGNSIAEHIEFEVDY